MFRTNPGVAKRCGGEEEAWAQRWSAAIKIEEGSTTHKPNVQCELAVFFSSSLMGAVEVAVDVCSEDLISWGIDIPFACDSSSTPSKVRRSSAVLASEAFYRVPSLSQTTLVWELALVIREPVSGVDAAPSKQSGVE